jgi:WD40 repeat protein
MQKQKGSSKVSTTTAAAKKPAKPTTKKPTVTTTTKTAAKPTDKTQTKSTETKEQTKPQPQQTFNPSPTNFIEDKSAFVSHENPKIIEAKQLPNVEYNNFKCKKTQKAHGDWILHILSLKNSRIITCSEDKTMKLWDFSESSNKPLVQYKGHTEGVLDLIQFTKSKIVSCSRDKTLRIWNIETGKELVCIKNNQPYYCIKQVSDAQIACAGGDADIRIYDLSKEDETVEVFKLSGHELVIRDLEMIDENTIASCSEDKTIKVWDLNNKKLLYTLEGHGEGVKCIKLLKDGRLASGAYDNLIKLWDLKEKKCVATLKGHTGHVLCLEQLPDERLVSGGSDWSIIVWDIKNNKLEKEVEGHNESVNTIVCLPNGAVLSGSTDCTLKMWE